MIARTLYNNQIIKSGDLSIVQLIIKLKSVEKITEKMKGYTNKSLISQLVTIIDFCKWY